MAENFETYLNHLKLHIYKLITNRVARKKMTWSIQFSIAIRNSSMSFQSATSRRCWQARRLSSGRSTEQPPPTRGASPIFSFLSCAVHLCRRGDLEIMDNYVLNKRHLFTPKSLWDDRERTRYSFLINFNNIFNTSSFLSATAPSRFQMRHVADVILQVSPVPVILSSTNVNWRQQ